MKSTALILAAALVSTSASAVTINGLYNSGVNSGVAGWGFGSGTTTGNGVDPHWTIVGGTAYNGGTNGVFPIGPWLSENASNPNSRWLTPTNNAADSESGFTTRTYRLTFDLTGFRPGTASFTGRFSSDNDSRIFLNGNLLGSSGFASFGSWTGFNTSSGFLAGVNTIDVIVNNGSPFEAGGPTGARIEFTASDVLAVPEPAQWAMMLGGFGILGAALRRRRDMVRVTYA